MEVRSGAGSLLEDAAELSERPAPAAHPADRHMLAVAELQDRLGIENLPDQPAGLTRAAHADEVLERAVGREDAGRLRAAGGDAAELLLVRAAREPSLQRVADEEDADAANSRVDRDNASAFGVGGNGGAREGARKPRRDVNAEDPLVSRKALVRSGEVARRRLGGRRRR